MAEELAAVNAAFEDFKLKYPDAANYFCFLSGCSTGSGLAKAAFEEDLREQLAAEIEAMQVTVINSGMNPWETAMKIKFDAASIVRGTTEEEGT